ncbi:LysR family transcriptional regulator [Vibrio misgurnus]|uniref:LysR family transcriptional regulator n=1 Tax=Vibrio misgurnus TaxID=2993714 RepID=UPI0023FA178D|nr:LysR family transcriptional regulator [Vibrio sp. VCS]
MDTESIKLFVLAATRLNISSAGKELGMAPAVASARLAKLENQMEVELLHRSTRKVSLSLEGSEFLPYAREIIAQEAAARAAMGLGQAIAKGTLRFTASSTFAQLYIAPILADFLEEHPGVNLELRFSDTQFNLIEGSFDLALRNAPLDDSSLKCRKLANDRRILCASPSYLAQRGVPKTPGDLTQHHLIGFQDKSSKALISRSGVKAYFAPLEGECRLVLDDGYSKKVVTQAGAGISINSLWCVHQELKDGSLVHVLPEFDIQDDSAVWLIYPKTNVLTAKVRVFMDFLLNRIGKNPIWEQTD